MYGLKGRLYLVYNIFISADFIQIDDMPPIIPVARDIEDVDSNVVIHLPYKKYYKLKDVDFTEEFLKDTSVGELEYTCKDSHGVSRKIKFLKLKNMLERKKTLDF